MTTDERFRARYGPWALVAGAGEGIGAAWAEALGARGLSLVLIDHAGELLAATAERVRADTGVEVATAVVDLAEAGVDERVAATVGGREIGLLVYNAAHSPIGPYLDAPMADVRRAVAVNCLAPAALVHRFGRDMRARRRGGIVLMSSLSAFQGGPYVALYAATKAYNLVLAEGIGAECRADGVDVLACCPGATRTRPYLASRPSEPAALAPPEMEPRDVVRETLDALGRRAHVIPGRANRLGAFVLQRVLSRARAVAAMERVGRRLRAPRASGVR